MKEKSPQIKRFQSKKVPKGYVSFLSIPEIQNLNIKKITRITKTTHNAPVQAPGKKDNKGGTIPEKEKKEVRAPGKGTNSSETIRRKAA